MMDVKQAREEIGFSQAELADAVGVTTRTIQNWEAGISSPKPPQVKAIERLLRILRTRHRVTALGHHREPATGHRIAHTGT